MSSFTNHMIGDRMKRQLKTTEVQHRFIGKLWEIIDYWTSQCPEARNSLEGAIHSVLVVIDGESPDLPPFLLLPGGNPENPYADADGNIFPTSCISSDLDIAGSLNDQLFQHEKAFGAARAFRVVEANADEPNEIKRLMRIIEGLLEKGRYGDALSWSVELTKQILILHLVQAAPTERQKGGFRNG